MAIKLKYEVYEKSGNKLKKTAISKNRLFFREENDDVCYPLTSHITYMCENNILEMDIIVAERETHFPYFFCKYYQQIGEKDNCGTMCKAYQPRNGKSGICEHYGYTYSPTDKIFTLKLVELKNNNNKLTNKETICH